MRDVVHDKRNDRSGGTTRLASQELYTNDKESSGFFFPLPRIPLFARYEIRSALLHRRTSVCIRVRVTA